MLNAAAGPVAPMPPRDPVATLVLAGGRVLDPASGHDATADVAIADRRVLAVGPDLAAANPGARVLDCTGLLVTPGMIDLHAHVMAGLGDFCVTPDRAGVDSGVTTVVDGGTSGVATFGLARNYLEASAPATKVLAFMDPSQLYLATGDFICHKLRIADDERNLDLDATAAALEAHRDVVVGLKVRATHVGDDQRSPFLDGAKAVAGDRPIMVHLGRFPHTPVITVPALLGALRPGDVITHAYRGGGGQLDPLSGQVTPEFRDAVAKGLRLDVGHSATDFRFRTARRLFEAGYLPDTVSTDLNAYNVDSVVVSLAETISKVWALGVDLLDVVAMVTTGPARTIGRSDLLGDLGPGRVADISLLRVEDGPAELSDGYEEVMADRRLVAAGCLRAGRYHAATVGVPQPVAA